MKKRGKMDGEPFGEGSSLAMVATEFKPLIQRYVWTWLPLAALLIIAFVSFSYGWYFDNSKPQSGASWSDQDYYKRVTDKLVGGEGLEASDLHYSVGYSILGVIGSVFNPDDPFVIISALLFLVSIAFCFLASKKLLGVGWAVVFCGLLLTWDGVGRSFNFATELFIVPWNNQVTFFAMTFFFWALVTKVNQQLSYRMVATTGLVVGLSVLTREETVLFFVPLAVSLLYLSRASFKKWVVCGAIAGICLTPQVYYKVDATGSLFVSTHDDSYMTTLTQKYFQPDQLHENTLSTVLSSSLYHEPTQRLALFQAAPWLWLSVPGVVFVLVNPRYDKGLKAYMLVSVFLLVFYLSGANMSGQKLRFHCLRYISPALILLNLSSTVFIKELMEFLIRWLKKPV